MKQTIKNKLMSYSRVALASAAIATGIGTAAFGLEYIATLASLGEVQMLNGSAQANNTAALTVDESKNHPFLKYGIITAANHYLEQSRKVLSPEYGTTQADYIAGAIQWNN